MFRKFFLVVFTFLSVQTFSYAQSNLRKADLCPDFSEVDPLLECSTVESYAGLAETLENAPSGSDITLCPFFIRKVTSVQPITVKRGVQVRCARKTPDEFCTIIGLGNHLVIDTAEDTLWQGLSFRGSNDHAVLVPGEVANSELATHTFCQVSFLENSRTKDTRGGALMLERSAGTINVVESFFQENFSTTFGAAIYSRTNQLNIILSVFVKNRSTGFGPALFTATGGNVMIKSSSFLGNRGRDDHDIVFNPVNGTSIYEDGFENRINDGDCRGVFNLAKESCIKFEKLPPSPSPTTNPTSAPTLRPTAIPTQKPTTTPSASPTNRPTVTPTSRPTTTPTQTPTTKPSRKPTTQPSAIMIAKTPTNPPLETVNPTVRSTPGPITTTKPPTLMPTLKTTDAVDDSASNGEFLGEIIAKKCQFRMIPTGRKCLDVNSFADFKLVVERAAGVINDVIFCGGFNIRKTSPAPVNISKNLDIRCLDRCSFYGVGPFLNIGGVTRIRFQNLKFINSQDSSAVIISTTASAAQTTLCDTQFARNKVSIGNNDLGGAITVENGSGVVNVVNNTFTGNIAPQGGAIHSNGYKLNVVGSKFVANNAYSSGNAIFVGSENHLSVHSSTFILNTEVLTRSSGRGGQDTNRGFAIAVGQKSIRDGSQEGKHEVDSTNTFILSGSCKGAASKSGGCSRES